jgi:hypothetical protein
MKKASIIAAAVLLIGSSAVSYAAGLNNGSHGASGSAPGFGMQTTVPQDRGAAQGASRLTPAYEMKTQPPAPNGASTFAPGTSAPGRHK